MFSRRAPRSRTLNSTRISRRSAAGVWSSMPARDRPHQTILIAIEDVTGRKQAQEDRKERIHDPRVAGFGQSVRRRCERTRKDRAGQRQYGKDVRLQPGGTARAAARNADSGERPGSVTSSTIRVYFANMQNRPMGIGLDLQGRRKDGHTFPVEIGLSAIETAAGKLAVAFVSDITQRRRLERRAQAHAQEVQALAASLLTAQEEERRRVSRELHDQICQQLASLAIDIGGLAADAPASEGNAEGLESAAGPRRQGVGRDAPYRLRAASVRARRPGSGGFPAGPLQGVFRADSGHRAEIHRRRAACADAPRGRVLSLSRGAGEPAEYRQACKRQTRLRRARLQEGDGRVDDRGRRRRFRSEGRVKGGAGWD